MTGNHKPSRRVLSGISVVVLGALLPACASGSNPNGDSPSATRPTDISLAINIYDDSQLRYVINNAAPYFRPHDMFVLVSGNNDTSLTMSWLNSSAAILKQYFPKDKVYAYTAGLENVATIARKSTRSITGVVYGYEPEMANEPEFSWSFPKALNNMHAAARSVERYGKKAATAPTGRPLLESDLQRYGWNYGRVSKSMDTTIVQTQTWAAKGRSTLAHALRLLQQEYAGTTESWMPQLTVDSTDTNGISPHTAYSDTRMMETDKMQYVSIWWSDETSYLGAYLALLRSHG